MTFTHKLVMGLWQKITMDLIKAIFPRNVYNDFWITNTKETHKKKYTNIKTQQPDMSGVGWGDQEL